EAVLLPLSRLGGGVRRADLPGRGEQQGDRVLGGRDRVAEWRVHHDDTARGIVVMNTPFGNSITTAEHAIALLFAAARQIGTADASTQAGKWEKNRFMGVELYAKTLGIIGCGNIGALVAERALGLKMKVIAYDPFLSSERAVKLGVEKVELDDLLARADAISLHTPLTDKTRNILSAEAIAKARKGVI